MLVFITFILLLSILVLIHEFGHFITAKKSGIHVEEFGIGIPPRLFGKQVGDTLYSVNLLPFGGFVKLKGEESDSITQAELTDPRNFLSKTPGQRFVILVAGAFMNLLLGIFLYYVLLFANGLKTLSIPVFFDFNFPFGREEVINTTVNSFSHNSPALSSGVEAGEAILELDGVAVYSVADVRAQLQDKVGEDVRVLLMDLRTPQRPVRTITVTPVADETGGGVLGVYLGKSVQIHYDSKWQRIFAGPLHVANMVVYSSSTLANLVGLSFQERTIEPVSSTVSGPVGIYSVVKGIYTYGGSGFYLSLIDLTALMSLSLAIINLLPFPALDGGRAAFVVWEKISGRRVNPVVENNMHKWGMLFLFGLLILISVRDIANIVNY